MLLQSFWLFWHMRVPSPATAAAPAQAIAARPQTIPAHGVTQPIAVAHTPGLVFHIGTTAHRQQSPIKLDRVDTIVMNPRATATQRNQRIVLLLVLPVLTAQVRIALQPERHITTTAQMATPE